MAGSSDIIKPLTLVIVHDDERVLLGLKKRGFGVGRWNGFGGKIEKGESPQEAAHRELWEEAGVRLETLEEGGELQFRFLNDPSVLVVTLFRGRNVDREPQESEEMKPQWFRQKDIPFTAMWPDDVYWLPHFLRGAHIQGTFRFIDQQTIHSHQLHVNGRLVSIG